MTVEDDLVDINTCLRHAIYYRHFMEHLQVSVSVLSILCPIGHPCPHRLHALTPTVFTLVPLRPALPCPVLPPEQKEYNSENLMFWKACQDYIKKFNTSKGKSAAVGMAKTIFTSYIEDGAALQVNISSSAQTKIAAGIQKEELIDVHIFGTLRCAKGHAWDKRPGGINSVHGLTSVLFHRSS